MRNLLGWFLHSNTPTVSGETVRTGHLLDSVTNPPQNLQELCGLI